MWRASILAIWVFVLCGCAADDSPERQIRELIGRAETSLESRALADAGSLVSDFYLDRERRTKQTVVRLLGGYFLRNQSIHLLVQIDRIDLNDPDRPMIVLYAAMAAKPFADVEELLALRTALYRFELELIREEDQWRFVSGLWQPASREDFLGIRR